MTPVNYTHPTGLKFTTERLMDRNEAVSHNISAVCMWFVDTHDALVEVIDTYCGEPSYETTKALADAYVVRLSPAAIQYFIECQTDGI